MANELITVRRLIADDAHALTFQTFGQYRTALLKAVDALALTSPVAPEQVVAASAFQKALDIRVEQGWQLGGNACPVLYTDTINGQQVCRDDLWLATTAGLKGASPEAAPAAMEGDYPPLPKPTSWQIALIQDNEHGQNIVGWRDEFSETSFNFSYLPKRTMFTAEQMRAFIDADRALRPAATPAAPSEGVTTIMELVDTLVASMNEAHLAKTDDWKQACFDAADRTIENIRAALAQPAPVQAGAQQAAANWMPIATVPDGDDEFLVGGFDDDGKFHQAVSHNENPAVNSWRGWNHRNGPLDVRVTYWKPLDTPTKPESDAPTQAGAGDAKGETA